MARSHFSFEKRRKELDKKAKKEAKRQAKLERKAQAEEDGTIGSGPEVAPLDDPFDEDGAPKAAEDEGDDSDETP